MSSQDNPTDQPSDQAPGNVPISRNGRNQSGLLNIAKILTTYHVTVEPAVFLFLLALYVEFPSIQDLIYTKICFQIISNHNINNGSSLQYYNGHVPIYNLDQGFQACDKSNKSLIPADMRIEISSQYSVFWLRYELVICLLSALSCPHWGGISDKIGRIIPLNAPAVAAIISNVLSSIVGVLLSLNVQGTIFSNIEWLYVGAVLTGISGGQGNVVVNAFSFISDSTNPRDRSKRVTVLESVMFLGHSFGYYIAKRIMSLVPLDRPWLNRHFVAFSTCATINLTSVLYSILRFRKKSTSEASNETSTIEISDESITDQACATRVDVTSTSSNTPRAIYLTLIHYRETFWAATKPRESRAIILLLLLCGFISAMTLTCLMFLLYTYLRMEPFSWNTSQYSSWNFIASMTQGLALIGLTLSMRFMKSWNVPDTLVAIIGYLSKGVGLLMVSLAQSPSIINWSLLAFVFSEYSMPPIRSLLSKQVASNEVAKIYSCLATMQSICFLVANIVYYITANQMNLEEFFRISFLVVGCSQFIAVILLILIHQILKRHNDLVRSPND